ncbi:MAG: ribosome recycling factor, partial [Clostridiales bacterium]|nr:ribosome recycling factor [Clostridiales bacterium]
AKVAIRNIRRDAVDAFGKAQKKTELTEDDVKILEKEIQTLTDKYITELDKKVEAKNKEIMTV